MNKICTSLEQSKRLIELGIDVNSADMVYHKNLIDLNFYPSINRKVWLCSYMPNAIENMKTDKFKQITHADSLVDAAYEMIIWLKENNYL